MEEFPYKVPATGRASENEARLMDLYTRYIRFCDGSSQAYFRHDGQTIHIGPVQEDEIQVQWVCWIFAKELWKVIEIERSNNP